MDTHFFRMPIKMRSLELSLWFSSGGGAIVGGALDADMLEDRGVAAGQRNKGAEARVSRFRGRVVSWDGGCSEVADRTGRMLRWVKGKKVLLASEKVS